MVGVFDKRKARRLQLRKPAPAKLGPMPVWILDVSETGAGIDHSAKLTWGETAQLEFWWNKDKIVISCDVVRTEERKGSADPQRTRHSGLRFLNPKDPNLQLLRRLVGQALTLVIQKQDSPLQT